MTYFLRATQWMRCELLARSHEASVFSFLASRAAEVVLPPTPLPPAVDTGDGRGPISVLHTGVFGIRLEVPEYAIAAGAEFDRSLAWSSASAPLGAASIRTLAPSAVAYLSEGCEFGELPYSPVVRVDYPPFGPYEQVARRHGPQQPNRYPLTTHGPASAFSPCALDTSCSLPSPFTRGLALVFSATPAQRQGGAALPQAAHPRHAALLPPGRRRVHLRDAGGAARRHAVGANPPRHGEG